LFGVIIFGPIVGATCLLLWGIIIGARSDQWGLGRRYPKVPPQVWQVAFIGATALYFYLQLPDVLDPMTRRRLVANVLAGLVVVMGGLLAVTSRRVVSFHWDDLRVVPRPILVALPLLGALCVLMGEGAGAASLVLGGPC
jgi:hypothetical protein